MNATARAGRNDRDEADGLRESGQRNGVPLPQHHHDERDCATHGNNVVHQHAYDPLFYLLRAASTGSPSESEMMPLTFTRASLNATEAIANLMQSLSLPFDDHLAAFKAQWESASARMAELASHSCDKGRSRRAVRQRDSSFVSTDIACVGTKGSLGASSVPFPNLRDALAVALEW